MDYALINYPLSENYRIRFEAAVGTSPQYLRLAELRRLPFARMLKTVVSLKAVRLFLPLEDAGSTALLPILQAVAAFSGAQEIEVVHPDLKCERYPRWRVARSLADLAWASFTGFSSRRVCRKELEELVQLPRGSYVLGATKRLLYLKTNLWFGVKVGGSIGHVSGVINALQSQGYQVEVAAADSLPLIDPGVTFHPMAPPRYFGLPPEVNLYRFQRAYVKHVQSFAANAQYSFLYQRMSLGNYAGVVLSRERNIPLVLEYNGSEVWIQANWGRPLQYQELASLAEDACLKHAHVIVTVSEVLRDELLERGVEPERIVTYPNCIDPRSFDPARFSATDIQELRARYQIAPDAIVAGFIGTFGQWHGVEILAAAIRRLAVEQPEWLARHRLHFLIVGDGLKMPLVREILADPRCKDFFTLTGLVPQGDAPRYLAACDILLSPHVNNSDGSRFFGSPTKLFEYMAMEKAIVASDLDQIGQVLENSLRVEQLPTAVPVGTDSHLALLCPPGDPAAIGRGVQFLVENPGWRQLLGKNSRAQALSLYTWQQHVGAFLEVLKTLASNLPVFHRGQAA